MEQKHTVPGSRRGTEAGRQKNLDCLFVFVFVFPGNLCIETFGDAGSPIPAEQGAIPRVLLEAAREKGLEEVPDGKDVLPADDG